MALLRGGQFGAALKYYCFGRGLFALALSDQRLGGKDGVFRLAHLGAGLVQLGVQHLGVHARNDLARLYEVTFVNGDFTDAAAQFGSDIDLCGFDAPVAAGEALAQAVGA